MLYKAGPVVTESLEQRARFELFVFGVCFCSIPHPPPMKVMMFGVCVRIEVEMLSNVCGMCGKFVNLGMMSSI